MLGELLTTSDKRVMPRWKVRLIGIPALAAAMFIPASMQPLNNQETETTPTTTFAHPDAKAIPEHGQIPYLTPNIHQLTSPTLPVVPTGLELPASARARLTRDTGLDKDPCWKFKICGTDVGHPFLLHNGSVGYWLGDTFATKGPFLQDQPPGADMWRSPVMMRSNEVPTLGKSIDFDSAAGLEGIGIAPEVMYNGHRNEHEITVLPNDAVSLPNGDIVMSYMSIKSWTDHDIAGWQTSYAGLAISHDGNWFERIPAEPGMPIWSNGHYNSETDKTERCNDISTYCNTDPFQMWSMQLNHDDGYIYIATVRAGRQKGPMMMLRVPWEQITEKSKYECWNGSGWGGECQPLLDFETNFGEPSLRKLRDGTWVLSYATQGKIITQWAESPEGPWSEPKIQLTNDDLRAPYIGAIHPYSTKDYLILMVSTWQTIGKSKDVKERELYRYDISHLITTVE